ncbi:MAG: alpha/beta hydrolase [Oscillospiraceae bacterium]|jgi:pimeloyl-ACP methyl ester carboxylesterase|nr:alpha/beta hydrolase [Oscillospiraceae bacterium]
MAKLFKLDAISAADLNPQLPRTVLILEGWGTNAELYRSMAEHIAALGYRVLIPDLPGFGKSPEPPEPLSNADYADFVDGFLTSKGIERVTLIGHSHGGRIAIKAVGENRLNAAAERIILIGSAGIVHEKTDAQKKKAAHYQAVKKLLSFSPTLTEKYKRSHGSADYRAATPVMRDTLVRVISEDLRGLLPNIKQPTLLIWGENDTDTPVTDGKIMEQLLPDAGLVIIPNAGHYAHIDNAPYVFKVLDSFLGGHK